MVKMFIALAAVVFATTAYAASAAPKLCSGQSCDLPKCGDLRLTKGPYYMWSMPSLHAKGLCRMLCGPHPCAGHAGAWNNGSQPASQHKHR